MQKKTAAQALKQSILALERRQAEEGELLKEQFIITWESLKPLSVLRNVIHEISNPSDLKDDLVHTVTGIVSGFLSSRLLVRSSKNPLLRLLGILIQYRVSNFVASHSDTIKDVSLYFIKRLKEIIRNNRD